MVDKQQNPKEQKTEKPKQEQLKIEPKSQEPPIPKQVTSEMDELMRRLKLLEERFSSMRKRSQFSEQTMLRETKEFYDEIKLLQSTISDIRREISELDEKMNKMIEELQGTADKTEVEVLAKYLEFWQPVNFLTREEAERLINEKLNSQKKSSI